MSVSDPQLPGPTAGSQKSPSGTVDVSSLLASREVTIRPQEDPADADLRRFKDRVRFLISWAVVLVVGSVALHLTLSDRAKLLERGVHVSVFHSTIAFSTSPSALSWSSWPSR